MYGSRIKCYLGDKLMLEARDNSIARRGYLGLWTAGDAVTSFDDVRIHRLDRDPDDASK